MKYLVTGATGLLGNNIVRQLVAAGEQVRVLARASSDPRSLAGLPIERAAGDVRDPAAVAEACRGVQAVIHSAGHVHLGWKQLEQHRQINVEGTRNVAAAARAAGLRMVHVSGINALGLGRLDQPADEETALPGIVECPYVVTKREAEQVVLAEVARGLDAVIVNPGCMFGPWDWKPSSGKMLLAVTKFAPVYPTGAVSFCDARDVAAGTIAAASKGRTGQAIRPGRPQPVVLGGVAADGKLGGKARRRFRRWDRCFARLRRRCSTLYTLVTGHEGDANSAILMMGRQQHCFSSRRAEAGAGLSRLGRLPKRSPTRGPGFGSTGT